jgi:hypothetical protein
MSVIGKAGWTKMDKASALKGTPNADEAGFLSPHFHSHAKNIPK